LVGWLVGWLVLFFFPLFCFFFFCMTSVIDTAYLLESLHSSSEVVFSLIDGLNVFYPVLIMSVIDLLNLECEFINQIF
jgi:hypothetical protein